MFQIDFEQIQKDAKRKVEMQEQIVELAKVAEPNHAYAVIAGACFARLTLEQTEAIHNSMLKYATMMTEVRKNG